MILSNKKNMKTLIFISSLFLFSCATVDFAVEELPYEEIKEAQLLIRTTEFQKPTNKTTQEIEEYFNDVIERLAPYASKFCEIYADNPLPCNWRITLENNEIFNAYAFGDNQIVIFSGLINAVESRDELAFVVAHEMAHHIANHITEGRRNIILGQLAGATIGALVYGSNAASADIQQAADIGGLVGNLRYSRSQENEADLFSLAILYHSGFDLDQAKFTLLRMANLSKQKEKRSSFFDSHPSNPERIAYFDKHRELIENGELFILD